MSAAAEFVYRLPGRREGARPGAHRGAALGPGIDFAGHGRLLDHPDPRRLDLRASLLDPRREWRVRTTRQRAAARLLAIVDVSASMLVGEKLAVAADFVATFGHSAFRNGDAAGLAAFDRAARADLRHPPRGSRGAAARMAGALRACRAGRARAGDLGGLEDVVARLGRRPDLVFLVSDFHFALEGLGRRVLEPLEGALVVPIVVWERTELEPPVGRGWLATRDVETGRRRHLWLDGATRRRWRESVAARRETIDEAFATRAVPPLHLDARFAPEALSRHFLENVA